jgi:predicted naringenin-chalcone synthase
MGMGCGAAILNLECASSLANQSGSSVLSIAVEICSATLFIDHWAIHPGGTAVLEKIQKKLNLSCHDIRHSLHIFEHYGNMSSPSLMFVLKNILDTGETYPGQLCCIVSFGAGFTAHAALVQII